MAFARLRGNGPSKDKEEAEVALLKAQVLVCEKDMWIKDQDVEIKKATSKGAKIAILTTVMSTGHLTNEQMVACRNTLFMLGMDPN
jgi:hypothetical protein